MPASVIAERVGWAGSASWFRKRVALLRPEYAPRDPADRLPHLPGDQAQCDLWFPPARIPLGSGQVGSPPVLVVVASFSRLITARMLPSRTTPDLLAGMWSLLSEQFGAVPKRLLWDNEAGIGRHGRFADGVAAFTGTLATRIVQAKPFDPETKGIVERANGYLETSAARHRSRATRSGAHGLCHAPRGTPRHPSGLAGESPHGRRRAQRTRTHRPDWLERRR